MLNSDVLCNITLFWENRVLHGTSLRVPRQRRPSRNWSWGPKLPQMQNLGGGFVVFFLGCQNRNFEKVRGGKTTIIYIVTINHNKVLNNHQ